MRKEFLLIERNIVEIGTKNPIYAILASQKELIANIADFQGGVVDGLVTVCDEEFMLPVILFTCSMLDKVNCHDQQTTGVECRINNVMYPFLALKEGTAEVELLNAGQKQPKDWGDSALDDVLNICRVFSSFLLGKKILLHPPTDSRFHESFPDEEDVFRLFVHTVPTGGEVKHHYPNLLLGIGVETSVGFYANLEPIDGRGISLGDEKSKVVQIIGNNIYLLFDPFQIMDAGREVGLKVFKKTLALVCRHILQRGRGTCSEASVENSNTTAESVEELADAYATHCVSTLERDLVIQKNKVREAEEELIKLQQQLRELRELHALILREDFYAGKLRERLYEEHIRIIAHPMVKRAYIVPKVGYEVETDAVYITHEGKVYTIGSYVLRFTPSGQFFIYTKTSHHPKNIPHPHICPWNGPCLGNAKHAIAESCAEYRFANACMYIIDWLTIGYTPELVVHHKVEEWPIATQHKEYA